MDVSGEGTFQTVGIRNRILILFVLAILIGGAVVRSSITTSLDGFTYDEAYHIGAGVSYVKTGDFRLNPEHPPLTKLWTGAYLSLFEYQISPFRPLSDKVDERAFIEADVYNNNDPDLIQSRARIAMFGLNALLMLIFALAIWRVLGPVFAIGSAVFLAIDPTVAAHLPVVMTDLPLALLTGTSVVLAVNAFRTWRPVDLALASVSLGGALAAKHSAVITMMAIAIIGLAMAAWHWKNLPGVTNLIKRLVSVAAVLLLAVIVLWAFYFFRYHESPMTADDQFNRPLAEKISDVKSPIYRAGLTAMQNAYLFPRSYTWGLADTIRAGAEGRVSSALAFGEVYYGRAPWFYIPGVIAVKLPIGLLFLSILGAIILIVRRRSREAIAPLLGLLFCSFIYLIFLTRGSSYGGIRHALPILPLFAVLASIAIHWAVISRSYLFRGAVAVGITIAMTSAIPVWRPWEYYNEFVGGTANGHRYFNDEGVDLYQRYKEAVRYYHNEMAPAGEHPYTFYLLPEIDDPAKSIDYISSSKERDKGKWDGPFATGTFIIGANEIAPALRWDKGSFREAVPIKRFGNLFVFRGTFDIRPMLAQGLDYRAGFQIYGPEPNIEKAAEMLKESADLDPRAFFVSLELGNQYLKLGRREEAISAYQTALANVPSTDATHGLLIGQLERMKTEPLENITTLRNPALE